MNIHFSFMHDIAGMGKAKILQQWVCLFLGQPTHLSVSISYTSLHPWSWWMMSQAMDQLKLKNMPVASKTVCVLSHGTDLNKFSQT